MKVGIGMICREEVGIIVAGLGVSSKILTSDVHTAIIIMVALTTVVTPIWLKRAYQRERIQEPV